MALENDSSAAVEANLVVREHGHWRAAHGWQEKYLSYRTRNVPIPLGARAVLLSCGFGRDLLEMGDDLCEWVDKTRNVGYSVLNPSTWVQYHWRAALIAHPEELCMLLSLHAEQMRPAVCIKTPDGKTAAFFWLHSLTVLRALSAYGVDLSADRDSRGNTLLHRCVSADADVTDPEVVRFLTESVHPKRKLRSFISARNAEGLTAVELAHLRKQEGSSRSSRSGSSRRAVQEAVCDLAAHLHGQQKQLQWHESRCDCVHCARLVLLSKELASGADSLRRGQDYLKQEHVMVCFSNSNDATSSGGSYPLFAPLGIIESSEVLKAELERWQPAGSGGGSSGSGSSSGNGGVGSVSCGGDGGSSGSSNSSLRSVQLLGAASNGGSSSCDSQTLGKRKLPWGESRLLLPQCRRPRAPFESFISSLSSFSTSRDSAEQPLPPLCTSFSEEDLCVLEDEERDAAAAVAPAAAAATASAAEVVSVQPKSCHIRSVSVGDTPRRVVEAFLELQLVPSSRLAEALDTFDVDTLFGISVFVERFLFREEMRERLREACAQAVRDATAPADLRRYMFEAVQRSENTDPRGDVAVDALVPLVVESYSESEAGLWIEQLPSDILVQVTTGLAENLSAQKKQNRELEATLRAEKNAHAARHSSRSERSPHSRSRSSSFSSDDSRRYH